MMKNPVTGTIPKEAVLQARQAAIRTPEFEFPVGVSRNNPNISISSRGPNNLGGRVRALAFDNDDANNMLAGGVSGGMFSLNRWR